MRNIAKNTRRATAVTLAAALAVACYLNWQYARTDLDTIAVETAAASVPDGGEPDASGSSGRVTDALLTEAEAASAAGKNYGEAQLVSLSSEEVSAYFDEARLTRTKTRDEALDTLQKSLKNAKITDEEKKALTEELSGIITSIAAEGEIESMIKAKGFIDCVAFLDGDKANIAVKTQSDALTKSEVAQIRDIVMSKSSISAQNVTVVEVQ